MLIKRKLIQKEFAETRADSLHYVSKYNDEIGYEIIKMIEFYDDKNSDLEHWMTQIDGFFDKIKTQGKLAVPPGSPQYGFIKIEDRNIIENKLGSDFVEKYVEDSAIDYINSLKNDILKMKKSRELKYVNAIRSNGGFTYDSETYRSFFKYIALCLTGQLNYLSINFWDGLYLISRTTIDFSKRIINMNTDYLFKIISNCLYQLKGYSDPAGKLVKYLA